MHWAILNLIPVEVFFGSGGTGEVMTDGTAYPFTFSNGAWTDLVHVIDIDNDEAELWIDGALVHTWIWSTKADGGAGARQATSSMAMVDATRSSVTPYTRFLAHHLTIRNMPLTPLPVPWPSTTSARRFGRSRPQPGFRSASPESASIQAGLSSATSEESTSSITPRTGMP